MDVSLEVKNTIKQGFMAKRKRIEDLGRICEMIDKAYEMKVFDLIPENIRCKDTVDWFNVLSENEKEDFIHSLAYGLSELHAYLADIHCLARWGDENSLL